MDFSQITQPDLKMAGKTPIKLHFILYKVNKSLAKTKVKSEFRLKKWKDY